MLSAAALTCKKTPGIIALPGVITGGTECYGGRYVYDHPNNLGHEMLP
jgi:hypothetical protein